MPAAAAYVRISYEEQTVGWSLEKQEQLIKEYADQNGYQIVHTYHDEQSGSDAKRAGFEQMMMDAHTGLFDTIIIAHTSRFFRNAELARKYKDLLRNKLNITLLFVNHTITMSKSLSESMLETLNEMFDEHYLHQLTFWTKLGKQNRARRGLWNGTLPFGYMTNTDGKPVPHPENAKGLKLAFESYATGKYSDAQIAELLNEAGHLTTGNWGQRKFTKDTVNRMLRNVFYLGVTKYKDEIFPGIHPALIDQALFDKCQTIRTKARHRPATPSVRQNSYVLAGIVRCHECELTLRCGSKQTSKSLLRYYRHMSHKRGFDCLVEVKSIRARELEPIWSEVLMSIHLPPNWQQIAETYAGDTSQYQPILEQRDTIQEKMRRVKQMYTDLHINDEEYRTTHANLQQELSRLLLPSNHHLMQAGQFFEALQRNWRTASIADQRDMTHRIVKSVYFNLRQKTITAIEPKPIFRMLFTQICGDIAFRVI